VEQSSNTSIAPAQRGFVAPSFDNRSAALAFILGAILKVSDTVAAEVWTSCHSGELADWHPLHQASLTSVRSLAKKVEPG
jgi:hypothetical protein